MRRRLVEQRAFFFGMVAILAVLAVILVWPFVRTILAAVAITIILKPVYRWLMARRWVRGSETRAAGAAVLIFLVAIATPAILIFASAISQASRLFGSLDFGEIDTTLSDIAVWLQDALSSVGMAGVQIDRTRVGETVVQFASLVAGWLGAVVASLGKSIPAFLTSGIILLVLLFVFLPKYRAPGKQDMLEAIPFPPEITSLFLDKIDSMITGMFKGTFVIAIAQGSAMGLVLWLAGVHYVMFFTLLSMFLSLVPLVGISLIAWPIGILLMISGNLWQGIFVIGAFLLIVANIDTVLRPILVPKDAYLNPALLILGVLGGLSLMGFIGMFYGPVILILLVTSIEVYTKYLLRADLEALQGAGQIDLEELGLASAQDGKDESVGKVVSSAFKSIAARLRMTPVGEDAATPAERGQQG